MAVATSRALDPSDRQSLSTPVQVHLGQALGEAYGRLPCAVAALPSCLDNLLHQAIAALASLADRDEQAFRVEFEALIPTLSRFAGSLTRNHARADDLLQETLCKAWRSRDRFAAGTNLRAWMFTIMRNSFYAGTQKHRLEVSLHEEDRGDGLGIVPDQLDSLDVQDVQRALDGLSEPLRRTLLLVAVDGLSYEEAAEALNCPVGTVKSRVSRGRGRLALLLGYDGSDLGADHVTLSAIGGQGACARL